MSVVEEAKEGRRERRARETRRRILLAAVELFSERSVDDVTIEEVADAADVARATIFNYFASKEGLLEALGELQLEMLQEAIQDGRVAGTAAEKIDQTLRLLAELPGKNPESCRSFLSRSITCMKPGDMAEHRWAMFKLLERWVTEGQLAGELRRDFPACEMAGFILGLQFQATLVWAYGFTQRPLADHVSAVFRLGLEGMTSRSSCK